MIPATPTVDLRELANRIARRQDQTSFDIMKQELGEHFTHRLECELATWTWRLRHGVPVSIEPHAYRMLVRMLIRWQRHDMQRAAVIR
jgi:hypothetical protein